MQLFVHGDNMESLYKKVPQRLLPSEYGGTAGTIKELNGKYSSPFSHTDWYITFEV
jgi:hypothetical protein